MPPGASEPAFPSASPTRACQPLSAARASPGAPARSAASANFRILNLIIILPQLLGWPIGPAILNQAFPSPSSKPSPAAGSPRPLHDRSAAADRYSLHASLHWLLPPRRRRRTATPSPLPWPLSAPPQL